MYRNIRLSRILYPCNPVYRCTSRLDHTPSQGDTRGRIGYHSQRDPDRIDGPRNWVYRQNKCRHYRLSPAGMCRNQPDIRLGRILYRRS